MTVWGTYPRLANETMNLLQLVPDFHDVGDHVDGQALFKVTGPARAQ
jgi:hypothetical protein